MKRNYEKRVNKKESFTLFWWKENCCCGAVNKVVAIAEDAREASWECLRRGLGEAEAGWGKEREVRWLLLFSVFFVFMIKTRNLMYFFAKSSSIKYTIHMIVHNHP